MLPPDGLIAERSEVALNDEIGAVSDSVHLERALAEAARLRGAECLDATLAALRVLDRGAYLPGVKSPWADERRRWLQEVATDARYEAAELAFSTGRLDDAEHLAEAVLDAEPFHEAGWRLVMRLASARGDDQGVLRSYQHCERVLAEVGAEPSRTTRQLVDQLRR